MQPTQSDRERMREKQDRLLEITRRHGYPSTTHLTEDSISPTMYELAMYVYPHWEGDVDRLLREFASNE
jgi:hypothetical protein